jgi:hypothetical protein
MPKTYERLMAGVDREFEQALAEAVQAHPWMGVQETELLRLAGAVWQAWALDEMADIGLMAGAFLGLANGAEAAGDSLGAWVFDQCYWWACALVQGEDYVIPELPYELAVVVAANAMVPGSALQC